jgi:hypothetical protein
MTLRVLTRIGSLPLLLTLGLLPSSALAIQYDTEIQVEVEEDLYDLAASGELSEAERDELVELLRDGVDINSATRDELYALPNLGYAEVDAILEYRRLAGGIDDPAALVSSGAITARQLEQIAPFLIIGGRGPQQGLSGSVRALTAVANSDTVAPPALLQLRVDGPYRVKAGLVAATDRLRPGALSWDAGRGGLIAEPPAYRMDVPKFFVHWKSGKTEVLAGTFRLGFGQRLTLDNTNRSNPDGFYADDLVVFRTDLTSFCRYAKGELSEAACSEEEANAEVTPDFSYREGFRGLAATASGLEIGGAKLSVTGFASYESRSLYQYEMFNRARCEDPRDSSDDCRAPSVYVGGDDPNAPANTFKQTTLPDLFDEFATGGNATLSFSDGSHLGLTGYFANPMFNVNGDGVALDFQEWSRYPEGGPFGAVGVDGALNLGMVNLFLEGARSFDSIPEKSGGTGGGFGVLQRTTASIKKHELELSLRYYDRDFANPYGRPIAAADEFEGLRARNEAGARFRFRSRPNEDWVLRGTLDFWIWPEDGDARSTDDPLGSTDESAVADGTQGRGSLDGYLRGPSVGVEKVKLSGWAKYTNKDVRNDLGSCYQGSFTLDGRKMPCDGEYYRLGGKVRWEPLGKLLAATLQYQHNWLDDTDYKDAGFRQDHVVWVELASRPIDQLRLRARVRWLSESIDDNTKDEQSVWGYLDASWLPSKQFQARVRYDLYRLLDERRSTLARVSPDEHRVRFEIASRF